MVLIDEFTGDEKHAEVLLGQDAPCRNLGAVIVDGQSIPLAILPLRYSLASASAVEIAVIWECGIFFRHGEANPLGQPHPDRE